MLCNPTMAIMMMLIVKITHSIHAEQHRCKWLLTLLRLPKSTQSSLDHKVPVDDDEYDDEDEDDEENDAL